MMPTKGARSPSMNIVLGHLNASGGEGRTVAQLVEATGLSEDAVRGALRVMRGRGEVEFRQIKQERQGRGGSDPIQLWFGGNGPSGSALSAATELAALMGLTRDKAIPKIHGACLTHQSVMTAGGDDD